MNDFEKYVLNGGKFGNFMLKLVFVVDGIFMGIIVVEMFVSKMNEFMMDMKDLGEIGEIYLVGKDWLMCLNFLCLEEFIMLKIEVKMEQVVWVFVGEINYGIMENYKGDKVVVVFEFFEYNGVEWVMIVEQYILEVFV